MKKRLFTAFLIVGILVLTCNCFWHNKKHETDNERLTAASSSDVYVYSVDGAKNYFNTLFDSKNKMSIIEAHENENSKKSNENVRNFDQAELNSKYNRDKKDNQRIDGTCSIVATLGLVDYFGKNVDYFEMSDDDSENFSKIYDACLNKNYTTRKEGTSKSKINNCVTESFSACGGDRKGNTNWWEIHNNIRDAVSGNTPIILSLTNHSTVVVGLTSYDYTYKVLEEVGWWIWEKHLEERTYTVSKEFVIINEGWGRETHSIVPLEKITDIRDGNQVCWAEK